MSNTTKNLIEVPPEHDDGQNAQLMYAIKELFDPKNLSMKTDIPNMRLLNALTRAELYATEFKSQLMGKLATELKTHLVSYKRKGRQEIQTITQNLTGANQSQGEGLIKKLMG